MNGTHILKQYRSQLTREALESRGDSPSFNPLNINPWLAMSLMQKGIRRGREELALRAAASLLSTSPERLWRRIGITVFEDIGVADFEAVAIVTAALKGKVFRAEIGGEWAVASYLVRRMCKTIKCRAADDLLYVCELHRAVEQARLDLTFKPIPELIDRIAGRGALPIRALALWFAIGTDRCRSDVLRQRKGDPYPVMDALCERGFPDTVVEICREGLRKTNEMLAPFVILLWREVQRSARHVEPDDLPPEELIGEVPGWAYDMHVREGNQAMARFLEEDCDTARWIAARIPAGKRVRFLGGILFRVESGLVDRRLRWETGDTLRRMADFECQGLEPDDVAEVMHLLRQDLPKLNEARRHVTGSNSR
jgi:hypothetical protein